MRAPGEWELRTILADCRRAVAELMKLEANALLWLLAHDALDIAAFTSRF